MRPTALNRERKLTDASIAISSNSTGALSLFEMFFNNCDSSAITHAFSLSLSVGGLLTLFFSFVAWWVVFIDYILHNLCSDILIRLLMDTNTITSVFVKT